MASIIFRGPASLEDAQNFLPQSDRRPGRHIQIAPADTPWDGCFEVLIRTTEQQDVNRLCDILIGRGCHIEHIGIGDPCLNGNPRMTEVDLDHFVMRIPSLMLRALALAGAESSHHPLSLRDIPFGILGASEGKAMAKQVDVCTHCQRHLRELLSQATKDLVGMDLTQCFPLETLVGYAANKSLFLPRADREVLQTHLADCPLCSSILKTLQTRGRT